MQEQVITMAHGSGGKSYHELVESVFVPAFGNAMLAPLADAALCPLPGGTVAFTTDSFVITPRFFPGGDIGRLAVAGTVNDLAMSGAVPRYLSCAMILEAGLPLDELQRISAAMAATAAEAGVAIVTGDTKVVEAGGVDGIYINTAGVGEFGAAPPLAHYPREGDVLLVSGNLGQHGLAVLAARQGIAFTPPLTSDVAPLNGLVAALRAAVPELTCLRDPTRGGLAATLHEWADAAQLTLELDEAALPVAAHVRAAAEILGLDPLYVANEGKFVAALPPAAAERALAALRAHPLGVDAAIIGRAVKRRKGAAVLLNTPYGGQRIVDMPRGELLPRIC